MKMAYICADAGVPVYGQKGCSLHVQEMTRAFRQLGIGVSMFARAVGGSAPDDLRDVPLYRLAQIPKISGPEREQASLAANAAAAEAVHALGPFDIAYERYALWSHSALATARSAGAVTVLEVNAPLIEEQARFRSLHDEDGAMAASLRAFAAADVIVAVSSEVADYLRGFDQAIGKIHVIPNGVSPERFAGVAAARAQRQGPFTLGFVGTLKPWHGVDLLIEAFERLLARVPEARLLIVGDGPERERLIAQCEHLGLADRVEFTGAVDPAEVGGHLSRMDVGVAPYPRLSDFYFSPLKVYEYLAVGMPVVASDIGQLQEIMRDGDAGILCEPGNVAAMADAFFELYRAPELRQRMGLAGQKRILSDFTWQSVASRVLNLVSLHQPAPRQGGMRG